MTKSIREKVLITGASNGLGKALALAMAETQQFNFYICGRNADDLFNLKSQILKLSPTSEVDTLVGDLLNPETLSRLEQSASGVDIFVNNAAVGVSGSFFLRPWLEQEKSLQLNIMITSRLMHFFGNQMLKRRSGTIINIASLNAFFPTPFFASYSAAKAFLLSLGEAIRGELDGTPIKILTVCPGGMKTHFHLSAGLQNEIIDRFGPWISSPESIARDILQAIDQVDGILIPGRRNRLSFWLSKLVPRRILIGKMGEVYKEFSNTSKS